MFRALTKRSYATAAEASKPSAYGQPLFRSHPHLVQPNELTPGFTPEEYHLRRKCLVDSLPDHSLVVSLSAPVKFMSGRIFYPFRQASDFSYLTGFEEPNSAVILQKSNDTRGYRMSMFSTGKDPRLEKWEGAKTPVPDLVSIFGADDALPITSFTSHLQALLRNHPSTTSYSPFGSSMASSPAVFLDLPPGNRRSRNLLKHFSNSLASEQENSNADVAKLYDSVGLSSVNVKPLSPQIAKLRAIKSPAEQRIMKLAADISGRAHAKTMRFTEPGQHESTVAAHFEYLCKREGAQRLAYVPVVASGANALIIHYTANNHVIKENEMVLIDAGCEYNGYASDITRTYPSTGLFTSPQRDLYTAVLTAQKSLVDLCRETAGVSLWELHRISCDLLKTELRQLGFDFNKGADAAMDTLYPHFVTHSIGIDLHESEGFDRNARVREGMVITVEPGIYVPPTSMFPRHFHNLAVRIEDDVVVGKEHPTVLSVSAPKEIADVEGACQGLLGLEAF